MDKQVNNVAPRLDWTTTRATGFEARHVHRAEDDEAPVTGPAMTKHVIATSPSPRWPRVFPGL
jgi:hypothetical protein